MAESSVLVPLAGPHCRFLRVTVNDLGSDVSGNRIVVAGPGLFGLGASDGVERALRAARHKEPGLGRHSHQVAVEFHDIDERTCLEGNSHGLGAATADYLARRGGEPYLRRQIVASGQLTDASGRIRAVGELPRKLECLRQAIDQGTIEPEVLFLLPKENMDAAAPALVDALSDLRKRGLECRPVGNFAEVRELIMGQGSDDPPPRRSILLPRESLERCGPHERDLIDELIRGGLLVESVHDLASPRAALGITASPEAQRSASNEPLSAACASPRTLHRRVHVLQPAPSFVGRESLLQELADWAVAAGAAHVSPVLAIIGAGGMGKTALVTRLLERFPPRRHLFVWSFYEDPAGERMVRALFEWLSGAEVGAAALEQLLDVLGEAPPGLVVLDGIEAMQSEGGPQRAFGELTDMALRRLLRGLASGTGALRAVLTSRLPLSDLAPWAGRGYREIRLPPLTPSESESLLRTQGPSGLDVGSLAETFGGHPLTLDVLASFARDLPGKGLTLLLTKFDPRDAESDDPMARRLSRLLGEMLTRLDATERALLARVGLFPRGLDLTTAELLTAQPIVAGELAGLSRVELSRLFARLSRRGLIFDCGDERWSSHPFLRSAFRATLDVRPDELFSALSRNRSLRLLGAEQNEIDVATAQQIEVYMDWMLGANRHDAARQLYFRQLGGFSNLGLRLGTWQLGERLIARIIDAQATGSIGPERWRLHYDHALYLIGLGDLMRAELVLEEHCVTAEILEQLAATAACTGLRTLAYVRRLRGRFTSAYQAVMDSFALATAVQDRINALALSASILHAQVDHQKALARFDSARTLATKHGRENLSARAGLWWSEALFDLGRIDESARTTEGNLRYCLDMNWPSHAAQCHLLLGRIAAARAEPVVARDHLEHARDWCERTGEVETVVGFHLLAAELAAHRSEQRRRHLNHVEALIDVSDMCLFAPRLVALRSASA